MGKRKKKEAKGKRMVMTFVEEGVSVEAELMEDLAPKTCRTVWKLLPLEGEVGHAIYSGSEVVYHFPKMVSIPQENLTSRVLPGDVAYFAIQGGQFHSYPKSFAEICWFYDRDARPSSPEGPVLVNLFARIVGDATEFYKVCKRIRREGVKKIRFSRA
ncbi:MAG: DUF3830 family protein [Candidatus Latescibacteria bacterium]|nr:DUF3830 family protein [Candidatus Latescibacterota bacterium]